MKNTDVNTVKPNINISFVEINDDGFRVSFDQNISTLEAGQEVYLQLPHNVDSQHDISYDDQTIEECLAVIADKYSDMDLSIMKIIGSAAITDIEIKTVASSARDLNDAGELVERPLSFYVLKNDEDFHAVEEDQVHKHYTKNKSWRVAGEISDIFNEDSLQELFDGGY